MKLDLRHTPRGLSLFNSIVCLCLSIDLFFHTGRPPAEVDAIMAIAFFGVALAAAFRWALAPRPRPIHPARARRMMEGVYARAAR